MCYNIEHVLTVHFTVYSCACPAHSNAFGGGEPILCVFGSREILIARIIYLQQVGVAGEMRTTKTAMTMHLKWLVPILDMDLELPRKLEW